MDVRRLIGAGLYAIALLVNIRWMVKHIASAGEEASTEKRAATTPATAAITAITFAQWFSERT